MTIGSFIFLAQAKTTETAPPINWPWFIVGCFLLVVAVTAFFFAFFKKSLTPSQHFLLMWILPLSSGFAAGCFAGSFTANGTVAQIAVTATGGFAVWLLSYYLLPKPPTMAPDSDSYMVPLGTTFKEAAECLAEPDGFSVVFTGIDPAILNAKLKEGRITAGTPALLMEKLRYRFVDSAVEVDYRVERDATAGLYRIEKV